MDSSNRIILGVGLGDRTRKSRWPARLDWTQSATGLLVALFMWGHMFFVSSILVSEHAMWTITKMFEGYFIFGKPYPGIVSVRRRGRVTAFIVLHAVLAVRKFPINWRQYRTLPRPHEDDAARGHDAVVLAGIHRFRAVLPRDDSPVRHADAASSHRAVRVLRPGVERSLLAAVHPASARGGVSRRHRTLSAGSEMGLVRGKGPERHAQAAEDAQVGAHRVLPDPWVRDARCLHQDRDRARAQLRPALRSAGRLGGAWRRPDEDRLHRCSRHRRRPCRVATRDRREATWSRRHHSFARAAEALALGRSAGRDAGLARQRDQGAGGQRGRAFRGHGARQRLGCRSAGRPDVRQHGAQGGTRACRVGRAMEPGATGRPPGRHQRKAGDDHRARRSARARRAARFRRHQEMAGLLRFRRDGTRDAAGDERPGDRRRDSRPRARQRRLRSSTMGPDATARSCAIWSPAS